MSTITDSLKNWEIARSHGSKSTKLFLSLFRGKSGFKFTIPSTIVPGPQLAIFHVYPAIENGALQFYVISADKDQQGEFSERFLIPTTPIVPIEQDIIPDEEAKKRIEMWEQQYPDWIKQQLKTEDNIYQAFGIPTGDLTNEEIKVSFALAIDDTDPNKLNADLIIQRNDIVINTFESDNYYDLVRPVPPFKPKFVKEAFYILTLL